MPKPGRMFIPIDLDFMDDWGYQVSPDAIVVWLQALITAKKLRHDGVVPVSQVRRKVDLGDEAFESALKALDVTPEAPMSVAIAPDDYPMSGDRRLIHLRGWQLWNDPYGAKASGAYGNHVKWHVNTGKPSPTCEHCTTPERAFIASESHATLAPDLALREEKRREEKILGDDSVATKPTDKSGNGRASTAPDRFEITPQLKEWASTHGADRLDLELETEQFLDHHRAKGTLMKDWVAGWRTWVRNDVKWAKERKDASSSSQKKGSGAVTRSRKDVAKGDVKAYRATGQDDLADALQAQIDAGEFD